LKISYAGGAKDKLAWRWGKGDAPPAAFGTPADRCGAGFALCLYDSIAGVPSASFAARVAGGGTCDGRPCWTTLGGTPVKGFKFKDRTLAQSGIQSLLLRGGRPGSDKISLNGKGTALPLAPPAPTSYFRHEGDVIVQLVSDDGACWESRFGPADARVNSPGSYKATTN
jgi:hypothetical protein